MEHSSVIIEGNAALSKPITLTHLRDDLARFAESQVAAGHFASVEDVCEAGLDALRKRQERYDAKVKALDAALEEGERSGIAEDGVFDRIRARHGLSSIGPIAAPTSAALTSSTSCSSGARTTAAL